jgi:hypothetical protein
MQFIRISSNVIYRKGKTKKLEIKVGSIHFAGRLGEKLSERTVAGRIWPSLLSAVAPSYGPAARSANRCPSPCHSVRISVLLCSSI